MGIVLIAAFLIIQSRDEASANDQAEDVATGFLEAYGAFDVEQAKTYLADDATIASMTEQDDLRLLVAYLEATGYKQILNDCEGAGNSGSGAFTARSIFTASGPVRSTGSFGGSSFDLSFVTERSSELHRIGGREVLARDVGALRRLGVHRPPEGRRGDVHGRESLRCGSPRSRSGSGTRARASTWREWAGTPSHRRGDHHGCGFPASAWEPFSVAGLKRP